MLEQPIVSSLRDQSQRLLAVTEEHEARYPDEPAAFYRLISLLRSAIRTHLEQIEFELAEIEPLQDGDRTADAEAQRRTVASFIHAAADVVQYLARLIDHTLTRRAHYEPDAALQSSISRELLKLGLSNEQVLVVVSDSSQPPCTIADIATHLSSRMTGIQRDGSEAALHIIALPFPYSSSAAWQAIVVGHELAHLHFRASGLGAADAANGPGDSADWLEQGGWLGRGLDRACDRAGVDKNEGTAILAAWLTEILCDFRAVDLYGPAAYAAIVESIATSGHETQATREYPSLSFRAELMWNRLNGDRLPSPIADCLVRFSELPQGVLEMLPLGSASYVQPMEDHVRSGINMLDLLLEQSLNTNGVRDAYDYRENVDAISMAQRCLSAGTPLELTLAGESVALRPIGEADIVNAWLIARSSVDVDSSEADRLGEKSLRDLAFLRQWRRLAMRVNADLSKVGDTQSLPTRYGFRARIDSSSRASGRGRRTGFGPKHRIGAQLSGVAIERRLESQDEDSRLVVTPLIHGAVREAGLDIRLSNQFIVMQRSAASGFDPLEDVDARSFQVRTHKPWGGKFVLHPNETILASVIEYIKLPGDLSAQVVTRSSFGRLGLISATAVGVNPWYRGCLTLELVNLGVMPLVLTPGARLAQLVFLQVSPSASRPRDPKYAGPVGPEFSRIQRDPETSLLQAMRAEFEERRGMEVAFVE